MASQGDNPVEIVIYRKSYVFVHPSKTMQIEGDLTVFRDPARQRVVIRWRPIRRPDAAAQPSTGPNAIDELYALSVPLEDIHSIRCQFPTLTHNTQQCIINTPTGSYPPLVFHNGNLREFIACLSHQIAVTESPTEHNVYLIGVHGKRDERLERSLSELGVKEVAEYDEGGAWSIMEKFARITAAARDILVGGSQPHNPMPVPEPTPVERSPPAVTMNASPTVPRTDAPSTPPTAAAPLATTSTTTVAASTTSSSAPGTPPPKGKNASGAPSPIVTSTGQLPRTDSVVSPVDEMGGSFEIVDDVKLSDVPSSHREPALTREEWHKFMDSEGRINATNEAEVKRRIFFGGVTPDLRREVWPFLLKVYEFNSTGAEREFKFSELRDEYHMYKHQWTSITERQKDNFTKFRERKHRIEKDVVRTDRSHPYYDYNGLMDMEKAPHLLSLSNVLVTYSFFNFDLGYVQGMSDLLAPLLYVMDDEALAFWCFVGYMDRVGANYKKDQVGMTKQLAELNAVIKIVDPHLWQFFEQRDCLNFFFCFRWLLIMFKREFSFDDCSTLWEVFWTDHLGPNFQLMACAAILLKHRPRIITDDFQFDELLQFVNELSMHINLEETLLMAESLLYRYKHRVAAMGGEQAPVKTPAASHRGHPASSDVEEDG